MCVEKTITYEPNRVVVSFYSLVFCVDAAGKDGTFSAYVAVLGGAEMLIGASS